VTARTVVLHSLQPAAEVLSLARRFAAAVRSGSRDAPALGRELYKVLFGGVAQAGSFRWYLVPDAGLYEIPFAALVTSAAPAGAEYLIERHAIKILPSAGVLLAPRPKLWEGPMACVGDPVYNTADPRWTPSQRLFAPTENAVELPRLPGSGQELERCVHAWGQSPDPSLVLTGMKASEPELRRILGRQPAILHFATHLIPSPEDRRQALMALSLRPRGDSAFIGIETVSGFRIGAPLVVVSGCSSGRGEVTPGEGLVGLTRAWLMAGARNVAATLWSTPDDSGELLEAFYRHLRESPEGLWRDNVDRAMQSAQVEMARSNTWRGRPQYWSAHFVTGR
jgi:CHAT domain-containing protein